MEEVEGETNVFDGVRAPEEVNSTMSEVGLLGWADWEEKESQAPPRREGIICSMLSKGVVWSGVQWSGVEWSRVEWSGVEWSVSL